MYIINSKLPKSNINLNMTLHEAIEFVLKQSKRPLSAKALALILNGQNYYVRNDGLPIDAKQIHNNVKSYPTIFDIINGQIILVEDKVWKKLLNNFNYLRTLLARGYDTTDIQFILAVLLFYKRSYDLSLREDFIQRLPNLNHRGKSRELFREEDHLIQDLSSLDSYELGERGIFSECAHLLSRLDNNRVAEIFAVLSQLDTSEFDQESFGDVFEYFLSTFPYDKRYNALAPTPYSLRQLMIKILSPTPGSSVHDPVAGTGGLLIEVSKYINGNVIHLSGNELVTRVAQLGNMNLIMHGIRDFNIEVKNSFYNSNDAQFDYIVADLPILNKSSQDDHLHLYDMYNLNAPRSAGGIGSFVLLILSKLKWNGKAVMTVSEGFLARSGKESEIRKLLLKRDVIESIVSLPFGALKPYTEGKASLLVLNMNKTPILKGKIRFITANIDDQDQGYINLNIEDILKAYQTEELLTKDAQILDISELSQDANLSADSYGEQYFISKRMLRDGTGRFLSDLVLIKAGIQPEKTFVTPTGDFPLVKIENLSKEILEKDLTVDIPTKVYRNQRYQRSIISEKCLLVARIGDSMKATIFKPDQNRPSIFIHSGVYALIPMHQNDGIDLEYLYYQFYSSIVLEQIKKRKFGSVMPSISIKNLKEIIIPYVDPESQRSFIELQKTSLISEEKLRANAVLKALGSQDEVRQSAETGIVKTLTHQLRPKLMEINSLASRIKRVIDNEGLNNMMEYNITDDEYDLEIEDHLQKPDNYPLEMLIHKMLADSEHLSNVLTVVDKVMNFKLTREDLSETNILHLLREYKQRKDIAINHRFEIVIKGENANAEINAAALTELFDQLLQNAEDHGFIGITDKRFRVQFSVKTIKNRGVIAIDYSNNGEPYELEHNDFVIAFEKGRKSKGSGIGGNYINRIIEAHGGRLRVEEDNPKGFALTIELPIKTNIPYD